jgi:hypothetical protein
MMQIEAYISQTLSKSMPVSVTRSLQMATSFCGAIMQSAAVLLHSSILHLQVIRKL